MFACEKKWAAEKETPAKLLKGTGAAGTLVACNARACAPDNVKWLYRMDFHC
jgi:hypothetical protein